MKPTLRNSLIVVIALAAGIALYSTRDNFHPVIEGTYYRSAQLSGARLTEIVDTHGIQSVINLRPVKDESDWHEEEIRAVDELNIAYYTVGMYQAAPRVDRILELNELLERAEQPVLFHCASGVDRTGLASVMVLLKEGRQNLDEVTKQVSWRYGVIGEDSVGKVFLAQYRQWLSSTGNTHDASAFEHWLHEDYVDPSGNVHFLIHDIHGKTWLRPFGRHADGEKFDVHRSLTDQLVMTGWAFDTRNGSLLEGVSFRLDDRPLVEARYGLHYDWLLETFGRPEWVDSGWAIEQPLAALPDGCQDLYITFRRLDGSSWESPPAARICIRPD